MFLDLFTCDVGILTIRVVKGRDCGNNILYRDSFEVYGVKPLGDIMHLHGAGAGGLERDFKPSPDTPGPDSIVKSDDDLVGGACRL